MISAEFEHSRPWLGLDLRPPGIGSEVHVPSAMAEDLSVSPSSPISFTTSPSLPHVIRTF